MLFARFDSVFDFLFPHEFCVFYEFVLDLEFIENDLFSVFNDVGVGLCDLFPFVLADDSQASVLAGGDGLSLPFVPI